jgi:hypothetical protein
LKKLVGYRYTGTSNGYHGKKEFFDGITKHVVNQHVEEGTNYNDVYLFKLERQMIDSVRKSRGKALTKSVPAYPLPRPRREVTRLHHMLKLY